MTGDTIRVLVVEDNDRMYEVVKVVLEEYRTATFIVEHATDMATALSLLVDRTKRKFGLVVLDLDLPDSKGVDSVKAVQDVMPETPIVVFSGYPSSMSGDCIRAGAQEYISKTDWNVGDITEKVRNAIIRHEVRSKYEPVLQGLRDVHDELGQLKAFDVDKGKIKLRTGA